nr:STAS domain-containing protein [Bacteroidota bacterium]
MSKYDLKFEESNSNEEITISLTGELTIDHAHEIEEQIMKYYSRAKSMEFNITNVRGFDLSFYQLLISFKKTCMKDNKKIIFHISLPEEIQKLLENSGVKININ